ncbi:kinase-like domain-containing protein [Xylaria sp. FL1042]|nr:kinase-like domain-containing protein [Xylaria sp. FL1042]
METSKRAESLSYSHVNEKNSIKKDAQQFDDTQEYDYDHLWDEAGLEEISRYNRGGFHPIHIEDVLNDRFKVVHKLGNGGFGTVWLCRDLQLEKWRAVKVIAADASSDSTEVEMFEFLMTNSSREELDQNHITVPLESFWIDGPNGRHLCLVMQVYGFPTCHWRLCLDNLDPSTKKDSTEVCGQIVQALAFLHEKGVCHGDFRPNNILMKLDQDALQKLDEAEMDKLLVEAEIWDVQTKSGESPRPKGPDYCVVPVNPEWCEKLLIPEIAVVDFGESFLTKNPRKFTGIPRGYAGPEVLFRQANGVSVDSWSLACTIYEVRTGEQLFGGRISFEGTRFDQIVTEIIDILGPLPEPYQKAWYNAVFGDSRPKSDHVEKTGRGDPLEAILGAERVQYPPYFGPNSSDPPTKYHYAREEVLLLADLLRNLLKYDLEERLGADSVLQHPWLQNTAASQKSRSQVNDCEPSLMKKVLGMFWG